MAASLSLGAMPEPAAVPAAPADGARRAGGAAAAACSPTSGGEPAADPPRRTRGRRRACQCRRRGPSRDEGGVWCAVRGDVAPARPAGGAPRVPGRQLCFGARR